MKITCFSILPLLVAAGQDQLQEIPNSPVNLRDLREFNTTCGNTIHNCDSFKISLTRVANVSVDSHDVATAIRTGVNAQRATETVGGKFVSRAAFEALSNSLKQNLNIRDDLRIIISASILATVVLILTISAWPFRSRVMIDSMEQTAYFPQFKQFIYTIFIVKSI